MAASILFHGASHLLAPLFFLLLVFVNKCHCNEEILRYDEEDPVADFILCRECGADIVDAGYIINKLSPEAAVVKNQTLFDVRGVDVQFLHSWGKKYLTITLSKASCFAADYEEWDIRYRWFPGYASKSCFCRQCGDLLGWMYEPIDTATIDNYLPTSDGFYLLILDRVLSEKCRCKFFNSRSKVIQELAKIKNG